MHRTTGLRRTTCEPSPASRRRGPSSPTVGVPGASEPGRGTTGTRATETSGHRSFGEGQDAGVDGVVATVSEGDRPAAGVIRGVAIAIEEHDVLAGPAGEGVVPAPPDIDRHDICGIDKPVATAQAAVVEDRGDLGGRELLGGAVEG